MIEKTAAKKFLRPFAAESEGIAMLFSDDIDEQEPYTEPERNISDRMTNHLKEKNENLDRAQKQAAEAEDADYTEEPEQPGEQEPAEAGQEHGGDLF